jgi:aarF domain-containing kinase
MRSALLFGRLCARRGFAQAPKVPRFAFTRQQSTFRNGGTHSSRQPRYGSKILIASVHGAALGTAAFVTLSEKDNGGTDQTSEGRMLEVSREEIEKKKDHTSRGFTKFRHNVLYYLDLWIWEPLWTGVRFLNLVVIFVPVIISVPALWIGNRQPDRDNERSGTLWWYGFLVKAMEWAGPAFIKV